MGSGAAKRPRVLLSWKDGSTYAGAMNAGMRHGEGEYSWVDGGRYKGAFKADKREGVGRQSWPDGMAFYGDWREDKMHGRGSCTWPNGASFFGEYRFGKREGIGRHVFPGGASYRGWFHNDQPWGWGTVLHKSGDPGCGLFRNGTAVAEFAAMPKQCDRVMTEYISDVDEATRRLGECCVDPDMYEGVRSVSNPLSEADYERTVAAIGLTGNEAADGCYMFVAVAREALGEALSFGGVSPVVSGTHGDDSSDDSILWIQGGTLHSAVMVHRTAKGAIAEATKWLMPGTEVVIVAMRTCLGRTRTAEMTVPEEGCLPWDSFEGVQPEDDTVALACYSMCTPRLVFCLKKKYR